MIAPQLFQTWKAPDSIPASLMPLVQEWRDYCASRGLRYEMFDDGAMDAFVREEDPAGYSLYRDLESIVEKTDYWRYLVVLRRGGYYADLDCRPQQAFLRLPQPRLHPIVQLEDDRWVRYSRIYFQLPSIAQFFFGFPRNSPVLEDVMAEMKRRLRQRPHRRLTRFQEILFTTGPGLFGAVVLRHRRRVDFFPENSLVRHLYVGSWTTGLDRGRKWLVVRKHAVQMQPVP